MTVIGKRIKELRLERGLSMDMIVADMNQRYNLDPPFNKSMISRWESQKNEPTLEYAKLLSMYFDVSVDYLIGVTDTRTPSRLRHIKKVDEGKTKVIHAGTSASIPVEVFIKGKPKVAKIKAPKGVLKASKAGKSTVMVKKVGKTKRPKMDKI